MCGSAELCSLILADDTIGYWNRSNPLTSEIMALACIHEQL